MRSAPEVCLTRAGSGADSLTRISITVKHKTKVHMMAVAATWIFAVAVVLFLWGVSGLSGLLGGPHDMEVKAFLGFIIAAAMLFVVLALAAAGVFFVWSRRIHLLESRIVQDEKMVTLGRSAAGFAHEINNILASIMELAGWIGDLLEEDEFEDCPDLDEMNESVAKIEKKADRAGEIIKSMLGFSRGGHNKKIEANVHVLLKQVQVLSEHKAKEKGVDLVFELPPEDMTAKMHISRLQQVILNLVGNAVDAVSPDGGRIVVRAEMTGGKTTISVADNGPGIPRHMRDRLFEPFYTTKAEGKGTGLGLWICSKIMLEMGGKLFYQTGPAGTTFYIQLED